MNLLIDPSIFLAFTRESGGGEQTKRLLSERLGNLALLLARFPAARIVLPKAYWAELYKAHIDVAYRECDLGVQTAIGMLRGRFRPIDPPQGKITTWGFFSLLVNAGARAEYWSSAMAQAAVPLLLGGESVYLFTGLDEGRTVNIRRAGQVELREKIRWVIYVGAAGLPGATAIPCICNARNVDVPWTTRYDDSLPDVAPAGGVLFDPVSDWRLRRTEVVRTVAGKPAWIDLFGNGWVRPNTPGIPHHWDVHFSKTADSPNGLNPCNIVAWGVPAGEGVPGAVHHVPTGKASRAN